MKPSTDVEPSETQAKSRAWWQSNAMTYDWHGTLAAREGTPEFYRSIDERFLGAIPRRGGDPPFSDFIPFSRARGARVLEVGCGMGTHSALLAKAGARLTSIDLTPRAVALTRERLRLDGFDADVREMDAEHLDFPDGEFDLVWSWGVIHHSSRTDAIVREVRRVLKPGGEFRAMVYHSRGTPAAFAVVRGALTGRFLLGQSRHDVLSAYSDGHLARFYTRSTFSRLLAENGFEIVESRVAGQRSDLVPLPAGRAKDAIVKRVPDGVAAAALARIGGFVFAVARRPSEAPPA